MDQNDRTMFRELPHFLLIMACASLGVFLLVETAESAGYGGCHAAPRRNLDRSGTSNPRHSALWRLARAFDQQARSIVRCRLARTIERAYTEPGAADGRQLLGNNSARLDRIEAYPCLPDHRPVFGRHGPPYP